VLEVWECEVRKYEGLQAKLRAFMCS
jgi:hypothetical protein